MEPEVRTCSFSGGGRTQGAGPTRTVWNVREEWIEMLYIADASGYDKIPHGPVQQFRNCEHEPMGDLALILRVRPTPNYLEVFACVETVGFESHNIRGGSVLAMTSSQTYVLHPLDRRPTVVYTSGAVEYSPLGSSTSLPE